MTATSDYNKTDVNASGNSAPDLQQQTTPHGTPHHTATTPPMHPQSRGRRMNNPYQAKVSPGPEGSGNSPSMHPAHAGRDSVSPGITLGPASTDANLTPRTMPATPNPDQRFATHVSESANSSLSGKPPSPMPTNDSIANEVAVWARKPDNFTPYGAPPTYAQQMFAEVAHGGAYMQGPMSHNSALVNYGTGAMLPPPSVHNQQHQQRPQGNFDQRRAQSSTTPPPQPEPGMAAHTFLMNKLRYVPLPPSLFFAQPSSQHRQHHHGGHPPPQERHVEMYRGRGESLVNVVPCTDLFVAQLPFNMDLQALQFLADSLNCTVDIVHAAPHYKGGRSYDGCAFVKVPSDQAEAFLGMFHKGALFDSQGVWVAETPDQRQMLAAYCNWMQVKSPHERRQILGRPIPFSAMTAEIAKRSYVF